MNSLQTRANPPKTKSQSALPAAAEDKNHLDIGRTIIISYIFCSRMVSGIKWGMTGSKSILTPQKLQKAHVEKIDGKENNGISLHSVGL